MSFSSPPLNVPHRAWWPYVYHTRSLISSVPLIFHIQRFKWSVVFLCNPYTVLNWSIRSLDLFPEHVGRVHDPQLTKASVAWKPLSECGPRTWRKMTTQLEICCGFIYRVHGPDKTLNHRSCSFFKLNVPRISNGAKIIPIKLDKKTATGKRHFLKRDSRKK